MLRPWPIVEGLVLPAGKQVLRRFGFQAIVCCVLSHTAYVAWLPLQTARDGLLLRSTQIPASVLFSGACPTAVLPASPDSATDLKVRADSAKGGEQAKLAIEYARQQLEDANKLFTDGNVDKAQSEIQETVEYARKAGDAASSSGKRMKQTEIDLRKLSKRMRDIAQTLAFEDRPPVTKAVDQIEQVRGSLLQRMFGMKE